jgi:hypothetical protein
MIAALCFELDIPPCPPNPPQHLNRFCSYFDNPASPPGVQPGRADHFTLAPDPWAPYFNAALAFSDQV